MSTSTKVALAETTAKIAVIGGSGFYQLNPEKIIDSSVLDIQTPYSEDPVQVVFQNLNNIAVAFIPRHGLDHNIPPHKINYRANIWALKQVGVETILAVNAVGAINLSLLSGQIVIPDQLIDYTWGREHSYFDGLNSLHDHIDFTEPYDSNLRNILLKELTKHQSSVLESACFGCTQGPRLETAAEVRRLKNDGCDLVGMTGMPEASLARELGIAYACIALVVNPAAGLSEKEISLDSIKQVLESGLDSIRSLINEALSHI